ncbi:antibiotic biosynthesis monooxygenase [Hyphomicrobium methylovorum]|uniref:antibiotic biosynthesis monooxygenase family protein n=1 Tax=Hyphomicrobium methylovorum TaxID=84 RepID=UPI0015E666A8|nr:antibiotic biosynthesis monooxygenase [Hyphomicrobium methylovorum]MBA2126045.1 antibiotic biosynthesis monooxygenase [Hyphomicrobium methylovorum]
MFIAMNRFKVAIGSEKEFEQVWFTREINLHKEPGFISFQMLRGPVRDDHVLYSSHTLWNSVADFEAWTKSESFRKSHSGAGSSKKLTLGHPEFEGFEVIQDVQSDGTARILDAAE